MDDRRQRAAAAVAALYPTATPEDDREDDDPGGYLGNMFTFSVAKYVSNVIASPVQVVTTLRQIEYRPSKYYLTSSQFARAPGSAQDRDEGDASFDTSSEDAESTDAEEIPDVFGEMLSAQPPNAMSADANGNLKVAEADVSGYLVRTGKGADDATKPPYEISVLGLSSIESMAAIVSCEDEGLLSLWKGYHTNWMLDMGNMLIQPSIEGFMNDCFDIIDDAIPLVHLHNALPTLGTLVASHALTGILLSPLELVRTRLIAQTSNPFHRKYYGTFDCLHKIIREEGPLALYSPRLLVPTILHHTLQPLFRHGTALIIDRYLAISPDTAPLVHQLIEFALNVVEIAVLMPIETSRRRMEAQ
ncbi:hypothetical protein HK101_006490, partial [Irineochytrium annulatum]